MECGQRQILFDDFYARVSTYSKLVAKMRDQSFEDEDFRKLNDLARAALTECEQARRALEEHDREHQCIGKATPQS